MTRIISRGLALTSLCLSLAACGSSKFYTLPADPYRANETQTMIAGCATDYGLESYKGDNGIVTVKYDETASLYYHYNDQDAFNLQVVVDDKEVPPAELQKKFSAVKAKGDDIYACAQMKLNPTQPPVAEPAPMQPVQQPSGVSIQMNTNMNSGMSTGMSMSVNTSASNSTTTARASTTSASASVSAGMNGTCAQAMQCYAELAKTVCEGASNCSFKAKLSGNDEEGCRDALRRVPEVIQPFTMMRPGLSAPAVCQVE